MQARPQLINMYAYVWHRIRRLDDNSQSMWTEYIHQHAPCMHNRFRTRDERSTPYSVKCMLGEATDDDNDMRTICIWGIYGVDGCIHYSILRSTKCIPFFCPSFFLSFFFFSPLPRWFLVWVGQGIPAYGVLYTR